MKLRVVAIPLFAAICLASPVISTGEQAQRGRGYRPRDGGGGTQTAEKSGADNNRGGERPATSTSRPAERREEARSGDRDNYPRRTARPRDTGGTATAALSADDNERYAVPRTYNAVVNSPRNTGSSYGSHYAPAHYDNWARRYYHWSPIGYAPWSLIYGSIGFSNYGFYGGVGPNPFYYGYNGYGYGYGPGIYAPYGGYPTYPYPHIAGAVRLKIRPRDAQVFVDSHYAGLVNDFDGMFQSLRLEAGGHKIAVRMPGFEDLELDVHVQPGRTITLEEFLRPRP